MHRYNFERYRISSFPRIIKRYAILTIPATIITGHLSEENKLFDRLPVRTCREKWIERRRDRKLFVKRIFPSGSIHFERVVNEKSERLRIDILMNRYIKVV